MHADTDHTRPGHRRIGALLLIRNPAGHVLLVKPSYKPGWLLVGGGAKRDEAPHLAARREAREETGWDLAPGDLLIVDYVPANPARRAVEGINFVFDGGTLPDDAEITLPQAKPGKDRELVGWAFVPPGQLGDFCQPYQHDRITAALNALADPAQRGFRVRGQTV